MSNDPSALCEVDDCQLPARLCNCGAWHCVLHPHSPTLYLIDVWGCVEPSLIGPIPEADYDRVAREVRAKQSDTDALFTLSIDADGKPEVGAFVASFFDSEEEHA